MEIKQIISQSRRDFSAIYKCEHCGSESKGNGYDDENFHQNVIPNMECKACGKKSDASYKPMETKYPDGYVI